MIYMNYSGIAHDFFVVVKNGEGKTESMFTTDAVAGSFAKNATVEWWLPVGGFGNI